MKHKNYGLIILGFVLSFNVHADILKEAQHFLSEINDYQGFWFYSTGSPNTPQQEDAFLKEWKRQSGEDLCVEMAKQKPTYQKVIQYLKFAEHHALLLFSDSKHAAREQMVRHFARQYQLPLIVVSKKDDAFPLQNTFNRLKANFHDVFLLNPQKRQITLLSRSHTPCVLEQELFFELHKDIKAYEEKR